ncbi:peroxiredoxin family protein [Alkalimarinus sediminis]|uniref:thioredoxin-dependent peroxiredoxin n=1 Tax=Alkalimarinus sediminis TaxID=1632866 RepID=A0A9E8KPA1_9ALTE|nr:peroxiredoxin family protein [Alkalimarinus sediminis]UZW73955.1 peroxiredoxin family protein [Alkalimarinus sediminis]
MNNLLKSVFISAYVSLLMISSLHAAVGIWQQGFNSSWVGVAIAVWPMMFFFARLFLADVVRTSPNLLGFQWVAWLGCGVTIVLGWGEADQVLQYGYAFGVGGIGLLVYLFWYSRFQRDEAVSLKPGKKLPQFELQDELANTFNSNSLLGRPALLIFYRGNWCPLCMAQIKEVAGQYQTLAGLGVTVALISPQPHENTRGLAEKFDVPFKFLVDPRNSAAKTLGIIAENGTPKGMEVLGYDSDTVMPTVLITDKTGTIIFADLTDNYRVRPEPETFIEVLKQHGIA